MKTLPGSEPFFFGMAFLSKDRGDQMARIKRWLLQIHGARACLSNQEKHGSSWLVFHLISPKHLPVTGNWSIILNKIYANISYL